MLDRMKQDEEGRRMTGGAIYNGGNPKPSTLKRLLKKKERRKGRGMHSPSMHSPSMHSPSMHSPSMHSPSLHSRAQ